MTDIPILHRAPGWICAEKPHGLSVHNEPGRDLVSILSNQLGHPGLMQPVHRLDRETSGLIILATEENSLVRLSALFSGRQIKKHYQALVHGSIDSEGIWDTPLSKQAGGRKDPAGKGKRQAARTRYQVLGQSPHYTLVEIALFTGRKHQIRRHAKLAGHPVVGDARYGSPRAISFLAETCGFHRMALHACALEFEDEGRPVALRSPLPEEIQALFAEDRQPR